MYSVRATNKINHSNFWNVFKNSGAYYSIIWIQKSTKFVSLKVIKAGSSPSFYSLNLSISEN